MPSRNARHPETFSVVAEEDGRIVGSNFLAERHPIAGVGPTTVDPKVQNKGVGALLMRAVMDRSAAKGFAGVRLVQAGYHTRSLSLYSKLGFEVREHLSCFQGPAVNQAVDGRAARPATQADLEPCDAVCMAVHGFARGGELRDAVAHGAATVVERNGRITGYATQIGFFGHAAAETADDLTALIAAARSYAGPGFLVPSRNGALMRWCLGKGLKITQSMTLMSMGLYSDAQGGLAAVGAILNGPFLWITSPRIHERHSGSFEIDDVTSYDGHAVDERGRRDNGVSVRSWIGDVQGGAAASHHRVEGEDTAFERRQKLALKPVAQHGALRDVAPFHEQNADLEFEDGDR